MVEEDRQQTLNMLKVKYAVLEAKACPGFKMCREGSERGEAARFRTALVLSEDSGLSGGRAVSPGRGRRELSLKVGIGKEAEGWAESAGEGGSRWVGGVAGDPVGVEAHCKHMAFLWGRRPQNHPEQVAQPCPLGAWVPLRGFHGEHFTSVTPSLPHRRYWLCGLPSS